MFLAKNSSEKVSFHDSLSRHLNFRANVHCVKSPILVQKLNFDEISQII